MRIKLLSAQEREAIICDFHKRLDRAFPLPLSLSGYMMWWLVMKTDRFLRIKRDVRFSFPSQPRWRNSRRTGQSAFNQVLIALIRKIVVRDRYGTYRENGERDIARISDCNKILNSNREREQKHREKRKQVSTRTSAVLKVKIA